MPTTYAIPNGAKVMDATLYTGTGAAQSITNANSFRPDFVWIKSRSDIANHGEFDSVRPSGFALYPNLTDAEANNASLFTGITSTGFSVAGTNITYNQNAATYVAWQWQAGQGTTSNNTSGTITSTVSANATAGFSIVKYAGNNSSGSATIGHGLSAAPVFMIFKNRDQTGDWCVYHQNMASPPQNNYMQLNLTGAVGVNGTIWNNTAPTTSLVSVGSYLNGTNINYVGYCWTAIPGFSAFGSYTGNSSTDGPFAYLGFRPKYLLVRCTSSGYDWAIFDTIRSPYNVSSVNLWSNLSNAEYSNTASGGLLIDFLSNGFKIRGTNTEVNNNGLTYIYAAFAENPFKYANAR